MEILGIIDLPLWSILLAIVAVLSYIYYTWTFNTWSKSGVAGPKPWPVMGTFHRAVMAGNFPQHDMALVKEYGKMCGSYRGRTPILDVADPEFLRLSMVKDFNSMPNRQDLHLGSIFDNFMTALTDDHWRHVRSSLSPTFTSGKLKLLKARIDGCADQFVKYLAETDGQPFEVKKLCGGFTMDTISSTAFGVQVDSHKDATHPMTVNANRIMGTHTPDTFISRLRARLRIAIFLLTPSRAIKYLSKIGVSFIDQEALSYFEGVTGQIISERGGEVTKQKDFVQLCVDQLIEQPKLSDVDSQVDKYGQVWSSKGLTKDEIIANAILFFLAGYETTALTLHYMVYELAMNPDVQERAYAEAKENMSSDVATYEELTKMEYLDWIINETMRLYPAAPRLERLVERDIIIEGVHLPAGSMVSAMVYAIHHDAEIWPEPERFDPERFSPENKEGRHQYAWLPFGLGNRNCIGMRLALLEMKVAMVKILSSFVLEPCSDTPDKPIEYAKNFRMYPTKSIKVTAKKRKTVAMD